MACYAVKHQRELVTTNFAELMAGVFVEMRCVSFIVLIVLLLWIRYFFLIRCSFVHVIGLMFTTMKDVYSVPDVLFAFSS